MGKVERVLWLGTAAVFTLMAADFWEAKPFGDWSEKEVKRLMTNSPWAKEVSISMGGGSGMGSMGGGRRGRGGGGGGGIGAADGGAGGPDVGAGGGPGGGGGDFGSAGGGGGGMTPEATLVTVIWQSALPVKQAMVRARYGAEAASSPDGKKFLDREETRYVVAARGFPMTLARMDPERLKKQMTASTTLQPKGRAAIPADGVELLSQDGKLTAVYLFPRTQPITLEDQEVEFVTRLGPTDVKRKFKLKDMMFGGKLEL